MADEVEQGGRNIRPTTVIGVVVAVLLGIFVFQNTHEVPVELFFWEFSGPLWLVLLVTIAVGLIVLELVSALWRARKR